MLLSFRALGSTKREHIKAEVTTQHPQSSYGQPVIVLPDGQALDLQSWILGAYRLERGSAEQRAALLSSDIFTLARAMGVEISAGDPE